MFEYIVWILVLGVASFAMGYFLTRVYISRKKYKPKLHHYKSPPEFDIKETIDKTSLIVPDSSIVDGDKALNNF